MGLGDLPDREKVTGVTLSDLEAKISKGDTAPTWLSHSLGTLAFETSGEEAQAPWKGCM